jgi:hypothetical protein
MALTSCSIELAWIDYTLKPVELTIFTHWGGSCKTKTELLALTSCSIELTRIDYTQKPGSHTVEGTVKNPLNWWRWLAVSLNWLTLTIDKNLCNWPYVVAHLGGSCKTKTELMALTSCSIELTRIDNAQKPVELTIVTHCRGSCKKHTELLALTSCSIELTRIDYTKKPVELTIVTHCRGSCKNPLNCCSGS